MRGKKKHSSQDRPSDISAGRCSRNFPWCTWIHPVPFLNKQGKHRDLQPFGLLRLSVAKNLILNKRGLLIIIYVYIYPHVFIRTCAYIYNFTYTHTPICSIEVCQKKSCQNVPGMFVPCVKKKQKVTASFGLHLHTGLVDQLHMRLSETICWAAKRLHCILSSTKSRKSKQFCWWPFWGENVTLSEGGSWPPTIGDKKGHGLNHLDNQSIQMSWNQRNPVVWNNQVWKTRHFKS